MVSDGFNIQYIIGVCEYEYILNLVHSFPDMVSDGFNLQYITGVCEFEY